MSVSCECGGVGFTSYGNRSMRVLDHDGAYRFEDVPRKRLRCRDCGTTRSHCERPLAEGFRMTRTAYEAIVAACLERSFASVAAEAGVDEWTVRNVFTDWADRLLAPEGLALPSVAILRSCSGSAGPWPQVVDGLSGNVCAAFPELSDPRFARYLGRFSASDLHLDLPCIGLARRHVPPGNLLSLHRLAAGSRIESLLPRCLVRLRAELGHATRVALRGMGPILLKPRFDLDRSEASMLAGLFERHPRLGRFAAACDEIRAVWLVADPALARSRLARWASNLDRTLRSAFQPILGFVRSFGEDVFTEGYGRIPKESWTAAGRPASEPVPGRSGPIRTVCRIVAERLSPPSAPSGPAPADPKPGFAFR